MAKEEDDDAFFNPPPVEKVSRLNLSNQASSFNKKSVERSEAKEWFEKASDLRFKTMEERKASAAIVVGSFWNLFRSKELVENKGPNRLKLEKGIVNNLLEFAMEANKDEKENEGQGSIYLITLLLKALLEQKERVNQLEHQIEMIKNR